MKTLLAIVLSVAMTFSGNTNLDMTTTETISAEESTKLEDGTLTRAFLREMTSWDELVDTVLAFSADPSITKTAEDCWVIEMVVRMLEAESPHGINLEVSGIGIEDIDTDRLLGKFNAIVQVYDKSSDGFKVMISACVSSEMSVEVETMIVKRLTKPEDGTLTRAFLREMTSWDELVDTVLAFSADPSITKTAEDCWVIEMVLCMLEAESPNGINFELSGIGIEDIDTDRLLGKFNAIVQVYDKSSDEFKLIISACVSSEMSVEVESIRKG